MLIAMGPYMCMHAYASMIGHMSFHRCDDITSSLILMNPMDGCPSACQSKLDEQVAKLPCTDSGLGDQKLAAFTKNWAAATRQPWYNEAVERHGCQAVKFAATFSEDIRQWHPCNDVLLDASGAYLRLFEHFCPGVQDMCCVTCSFYETRAK